MSLDLEELERAAKAAEKPITSLEALSDAMYAFVVAANPKDIVALISRVRSAEAALNLVAEMDGDQPAREAWAMQKIAAAHFARFKGTPDA